jgi:hypothetical protein
MRVAYRDDGILTLAWVLAWCVSKRGRYATYPPPGFVGLVSSLSVATDPRPYKLSSIALRRLPYTPDGPRWRLTLGWEIKPPLRLPWKSGRLSELHGNGSSPEADGAVTSARLT